MICPYCKYAHGTDLHDVPDDDGREESKYLNIDGAFGTFYRLPVAMERPYGDYEIRASMFGCPSCSKVFIEL